MAKNESKDLARVYASKGTISTINKMATKFDRHGYEIIDGAIQYFSKAGFDPCEMLNVEAPAEEMKKLRNSIVAFFKKHESEYLNPLVGKLDTAISVLVETVRGLPQQEKKQVTPALPANSGLQTDQSIKSELKFVMPDMEEDDESKTVQNEPAPLNSLQFTIALEKKDNEIKYLKQAISGLANRFQKKGDSYTITISKIEFEQFLEQGR
jgi:hypothetical protein